ncbi:MAG: PKD domain-containing protein [Thermoplasmata archaeon]
MKKEMAIALMLLCVFSFLSGCVGISTSNHPPKATANVTPISAQTYERLTFTAIGKDSDGSVVKYEWDFNGDGTYDWTSRKAEPVKHEFYKSGKYIAMLKVTDNSGGEDIATCAFTITNRAPSATITITPSDAKPFDAIQFRVFATDLDGSISYYYWDFDGNGVWDYSSPTVGNTSHVYMKSGKFVPKLRIVDDEGAFFEVTGNVTINNSPPSVELTSNLNSASNFAEFEFSAVAEDMEGDIQLYEWDFGDGVFVAGGQTMRHSFSNEHVVTVRVTDSDGANATDSVVVTTTNLPPSVVLHASATAVQVFASVTFSADASDLDGTIASYSWDFDNDGVFDFQSSTSSATFIYQALGTYTAKVVVTDDDGARANDTITISVTNSAPIVFASANVTTATTLDTIKFTGYAYDLDGTISTYKWDFEGDGIFDFTSTTTGNTTYKYNVKGSFNAKFVVTDNLGSTQSATVSITITNIKPKIMVSVSTLNAKVGATVQFHASGHDDDGYITKYEWDFEGDGTYEWSSTTTGNATYVYPTAGTRSTKARITDNNGGETTASVTITVTLNHLPVLTSGSVSPSAGTVLDRYNFSVIYTDSDDDPPMELAVVIDGSISLTLFVDTTASATLKDGVFSNGEKFIYKTSIPLGTHTFVFNASDGLGYTQTSQMTVTVNPPPNTPPSLASVSVIPSSGNINDVFKFGVIYDDEDNDAPSYIRVQIDSNIYNMLLDTSSSAPFHDGTYTNGEKYYYSTNLPAGTHTYKFIASDGSDVAQTTTYTLTVSASNQAPVLSSGSVTPSSGVLGSTFTFVVNYTDADNNMPSYVRVNIDGVNYEMSKQNSMDNVYSDGCIYVYSTSSLSLGSHTYKFSASDGSMSCNLPTSGSYTGPTVTNTAPTLTNGNVTPTSGLVGSTFTYMVTYTDANNNAPSFVYVKIDSTNQTMSKLNGADNTYTDGCIYVYTTSSLTVGTHTYQFFTSDGIVNVQTSQFTGPTVTSPVNHAPTLTSGSVSPTSGTTSTTFKYTVIYTDEDNNPPSGGVKVIINGTSYTMSVDTSATSTLRDGIYTNGEQYVYTRTFSAGTYNYRFNATDGSLGANLPSSGTYSGPTVTQSSVNKYALLVGIEDYPGSSNDLYYCRDDLYDWKAYLEARGYICTLLMDSQANYSNVQNAINNIKTQETASDYIAFIYSGHGIYYSSRSHICLYDYDVPSTTLDSWFTGFESTHIFFFFDCCNSGEFTTGSLAKNGRFIAAACLINEYTPDGAYWPDSHPNGGTDNVDNGLFTYEFLISLGFTHGNPRNPGPGTTSAETAATNTYNHITSTHSSAGIHPQTYDGYSGTFMF